MHPINRDATIKYQSITRLHLVKHIEQLKTAPNISLSVQIFFSSSIKKKTLSYTKKGEPTQNIVLFKKKKKTQSLTYTSWSHKMFTKINRLLIPIKASNLNLTRLQIFIVNTQGRLGKGESASTHSLFTSPGFDMDPTS